jgi:hypothetical protein
LATLSLARRRAAKSARPARILDKMALNAGHILRGFDAVGIQESSKKVPRKFQEISLN